MICFIADFADNLSVFRKVAELVLVCPDYFQFGIDYIDADTHKIKQGFENIKRFDWKKMAEAVFKVYQEVEKKCAV